MGRGGHIYLNYTALVLLAIVSNANAGLWDVSIDLSPAPSPEDGPPFSAHASRDRSLLPYQIIGIVASYLATTLIVGILLLTVGRQARKRAQEMTDGPVEMIKHLGLNKKATASSLRSRANYGSPTDSVSSFDPDVLKAHRQKDQNAMADIYNQYFQEVEQRQRSSASNSDLHALTTDDPRKIPQKPVLRPELIRVKTSESLSQGPYSPSEAPRSPSYRAIAPPREIYFNPDANLPLTPVDAQPRRPSRPERTSSFGSNRTVDSSSDKSAKNARKPLKISSPIPHRGRDDGFEGDRRPLTQPETPLQTGQTWVSRHSGDYYPEYYLEERDEVRDLPQANPQRAAMPPPPIITNSSPLRRTANATNFDRTLPLRQHTASLATTSFPMTVPQSATPTKTTFVEMRRDLAPGMLTGRSGIYSPLTSRGIVTPVTPRIMNRDERRQREREERSVRGVITEEDQVVDEKDLWSSGY